MLPSNETCKFNCQPSPLLCSANITWLDNSDWLRAMCCYGYRLGTLKKRTTTFFSAGVTIIMGPFLPEKNHGIVRIHRRFSSLIICLGHSDCSSRMIEIQQHLSERAIELLALPPDTPCFILDVGWVLWYLCIHTSKHSVLENIVFKKVFYSARFVELLSYCVHYY